MKSARIGGAGFERQLLGDRDQPSRPRTGSVRTRVYPNATNPAAGTGELHRLAVERHNGDGAPDLAGIGGVKTGERLTGRVEAVVDRHPGGARVPDVGVDRQQHLAVG